MSTKGWNTVVKKLFIYNLSASLITLFFSTYICAMQSEEKEGISVSQTSQIIEKQNYVELSSECSLFSEEEIKQLNDLIEVIGSRNRYRNGDNGGNHENTNYAKLARFVHRIPMREVPILALGLSEKKRHG